MDIRFCDQCDASIPESDVDRGVASRMEGRLLCSLCLPRAKRQRTLTFLLQPLALLAAVALGAAAAVWLVTPRIDALNARVSSLTRSIEDRPAVDPSVVKTLDRLGQLGQSLMQANEDLESSAARHDTELATAIADNQEKLEDLAAAISAIRAFLAAAADPEPPREEPDSDQPQPLDPQPLDPQPLDPQPVKPQSVKPATVDLDTWLPFADDPDSGVRLSALVAMEPSRDPRVLAVARTALSDGDPVVRAQAAKMVADRDDQESVSALVDLLQDGNSRVRVVAHRALEMLTGLQLAYDGADSEQARSAAVRAIRELLGR